MTRLPIKAATDSDRQAWESLWRDNCAHFGAQDMTGPVIDGLWQRICDPASAIDAWLAFDGAEAVGLAHTVLHPHSFSLRVVCCLEDLWVSPRRRGRGIATALIAHLKGLGTEQGWRRLYWETHAQNATARRLYDRLATRRPMVTYEIGF